MASDSSRALDDVVAAVAQARPHLVDPLEAVALIESLGYTDARMRREFGFADTRAFGQYVFERLSQGQIPPPKATAAPSGRGALATFGHCLGASLVYAVPWLIVVAADRARGVSVAADLGPPLSLALMLSLVVCGGFMQAIGRRGRFYIGAHQPGLAAVVCAYFVRLGAIATIAAAVVGLGLGWLFGLAAWPSLVLWADQFIVFCALWLTWAVLTVRDGHWRVPAAFAAGVIAFVLVRLLGQSAVLAQLIALGAVLVTAVVQVPRVFARANGTEKAAPVPIPRMTVVLFRELPFVLYGTLFFAFLFAARLVGGFSRTARPEYALGADLAVLSMLVASAGVEYAGLRFAYHLAAAKEAAVAGGADAFRRAVAQVHVRALAITTFTFVVTMAVVAAAARLLLTGAPGAVWTVLAAIDVAYVPFALGLLNALVLFSCERPWSAINVLIAGLVVNLGAGYALGRPAIGVLSGAILILVGSTRAVRRTLRRADHAVAAP